MMISTKGRYALRVAVDLAQNQADGYLPLKAIAERQEISLKYLEAIISALVRAELVSGIRGRGGGYRLAKKPEQITVGSILHLTEGSLAPVACLDCGSVPCGRSADCKTLPVWRGLQRLTEEYLERITLQDLVTGKISDYRLEQVEL